MSQSTLFQSGDGSQAWLGYQPMAKGERCDQYALYSNIAVTKSDDIIQTAINELSQGIEGLLGQPAIVSEYAEGTSGILLGIFDQNGIIDECFAPEVRSAVGGEGYAIKTDSSNGRITIGASSSVGILYGAFHLLRLFSTGCAVDALNIVENPINQLRMINQWDNIDGSVERGYAGKSIFYSDNKVTDNVERIRHYARLLASAGINAISINNVNVHRVESMLVTQPYLSDVARLAAIFRVYGIKLFLSANYASPLEIGGLSTADPLDPGVRQWWHDKAAEVFTAIPDFGGFLVKADSENRPGPFTYGRDHAEGANMLAEALEPFGGIVIWRCFVYNCKQDWRDRSTDRARAAFDHFKPLDGKFMDNVILQVKNGPIDFQVREPVSPLLGAMPSTNQVLELQITQEYTGQQRHLCYLVPQWKEILEFDTLIKGKALP